MLRSAVSMNCAQCLPSCEDRLMVASDVFMDSINRDASLRLLVRAFVLLYETDVC